MAASTGQGRSFATFLVGLTVACTGIAYFSSGMGKLASLLGAAIVAASLLGFLKLKPLEGKPAQNAGAGGMKSARSVHCMLRVGSDSCRLHLVTGTGGRIVLGLVGIGVSLFGIIFFCRRPSTRTRFGKHRDEPGSSNQKMTMEQTIMKRILRACSCFCLFAIGFR